MPGLIEKLLGVNSIKEVSEDNLKDNREKVFSNNILKGFEEILEDSSITSKDEFVDKVEEVMKYYINHLLDMMRTVPFSAQKAAQVFLENNSTVVIKRECYADNSSFAIRSGDCGSAYGPKYYCGFYKNRIDNRFNTSYNTYGDATPFFKMFSYDFKLIYSKLGLKFEDPWENPTKNLEKQILWVLSAFNACDSSSFINPKVFSSRSKAEEYLDKYCSEKKHGILTEVTLDDRYSSGL